MNKYKILKTTNNMAICIIEFFLANLATCLFILSIQKRTYI